MSAKSFLLAKQIARSFSSASFLSFPPPRNVKRSILREDISWFPGHMHKGIHVMNRRMTKVDCVIEIHDARLPYSGRSELISQFGQLRPHILVMNKMDLAEQCDHSQLASSIMLSSETAPMEVYFTKLNSPEKQMGLLQSIIKKLTTIFESQEVFNKDIGIVLLVAGSPNVGKSTFINAMRSLSKKQFGADKKISKSAPVGKLAGLTRSVGEKILLWRNPPIFVFDSPGVFEVSPTLRNDSNGLETILRLGATGCLNLSTLNSEVFADYLLYYMNRHRHFQYTKFLELSEPTDDILTLLSCICRDNRLVLKTSSRYSEYRPDIISAAQYFLKWFNEGKLGRLTFKEFSNPTTFPFELTKSVTSMKE